MTTPITPEQFDVEGELSDDAVDAIARLLVDAALEETNLKKGDNEYESGSNRADA